MDSDLLDRFDCPRERLAAIVADCLRGADDGELYVEDTRVEALGFDDGRLKTASFSSDRGFGLRAIVGETSGYAHSGELSEAALRRAGNAVKAVARGHGGVLAEGPPRVNRRAYGDDDPTASPAFADKVALLQNIDEYLRARDPKVRQVTASLSCVHQSVEILRADGQALRDLRPLARLDIGVVAGSGERQETGSFGAGGRGGFGGLIAEESWRAGADEALRQALVNLEAIPAPAGTFDLVLGSGWPGVMLHEAVGHGLEGDFNRKKTSAFAALMGERIAARGVTVVDDGTLEGRRGSLTIDDEGTPSARNVLIDDGRLVGYMQDRQNARLMGMRPTGNGRRQSYAHQPMPRMTNTFMLAGEHAPEEIVASVDKGLYAVSFGGGQVDITSGKFVFACTEAYLIEGGKVGAPVRGAMVIGNGPDAMHRVTMVGNDMRLDNGIGTCGKSGQGVPVGVGQPHLRMNRMTVGGTRS